VIVAYPLLLRTIVARQPALREDFAAWRAQDRRTIPWVNNAPGERVAFTALVLFIALVFLAWAVADIASKI